MANAINQGNVNQTPVINPQKQVNNNLYERILGIVQGVVRKTSVKGAENASGTKKAKSATYEGEQTEKLFEISDLTTNITPKKILKMIIVVIILLMIVAALYVKFIRKTPVRNVSTIINIPTPTYSPYQKYKPSVYADDPNFKRIDEGVSVLENEVKNTPLEEKTLTPPSLDFSIDFK